MPQYAAYPQTLMGVRYDQFDQLPVLTSCGQAWARRRGAAVDEQGIVAASDCVINGVSYSAGADLSGLDAGDIRRTLRAGTATSGEPGPPNQPPVSNAGTDQSVSVGALVTLNGSGSSDPDPGDTITYLWSQTSGTAVTLSNPTVASPTFTAPATPGTLVFQLEVDDGEDTHTDTVTVTVTPAGATIVEAVRFWTSGAVKSGPAVLALASTPQPGDVLVISYWCIRQSSYRAITGISGAGAAWATSAANNLWVGTGANASGNVTVTQSSPAPMDACLYLVRGLASATVDVVAPSNAAQTRQGKVNEAVFASHMIVNNGATQPGLAFTAPGSGWVDQGAVWDAAYAGGVRFAYRLPTEGSDTTHTVTPGAPTSGVSNAMLATVG